MERAEAFQRARAHVGAKRYDAALEIFRRLADQNPHDFEARNWVARLESWKGNYAQAEAGYRSVLADAPDNLEAELGLVDVLSWQERYREAMERLHGLRTRQPTNTEVLLRLGRVSRWQQRRSEALRYYQEVLALDPSNTEAREAVDILARQKSFRLETGYFLEEFDFTAIPKASSLSFSIATITASLLGRFQYQNKFEQNNTRYTLGATYRFWQYTWLRGEFSWAPAGDTVIANQDYTLELTQGLPPRLAVGGGYRFLNFRDAEVHTLTALLNWDLRSDLHLYFRYTPAQTRFDFPVGTVWNHGGRTWLV